MAVTDESAHSRFVLTDSSMSQAVFGAVCQIFIMCVCPPLFAPFFAPHRNDAFFNA